MLQKCQPLLSEMKQTGPDLKESAVLEKPTIGERRQLTRSPSEVRRLRWHRAFCRQECARLRRDVLEGPRDLPEVAGGRVTEERRPSGKTFRFGMYNPAVLLEKCWRLPKTIWETAGFWRCQGGSVPSRGREEPAAKRPRSSAPELRTPAAARTHRPGPLRSEFSPYLSPRLPRPPGQLLTRLRVTTVIPLPPASHLRLGRGGEERQRPGSLPASRQQASFPGGEHRGSRSLKPGP